MVLTKRFESCGRDEVTVWMFGDVENKSGFVKKTNDTLRTKVNFLGIGFGFGN
jgi:hypothetical protein